MKSSKALEELEKIAFLANSSKFSRLAASPFRYIKGVFFSNFLYPILKKDWKQSANTFWGEKMNVLLPSGLDIYLLGAKTHDSEIRLAHFLFKNCHEKSNFIDIGAHFGFFSLLAAAKGAKVLAFEPSPNSYQVAKENLSHSADCKLFSYAIGATNEQRFFYIFPQKYSEFNSFSIEHLPLSIQNLAKKQLVEVINLSDFLIKTHFNADCIKIDVEGAELEVISGLAHFLTQSSTTLIIEFLNNGNLNYQKVNESLQKIHYSPFYIASNGKLVAINTSIFEYMKKENLDSDNIVFKRL